ncbi:MAG: YciI family protein [Xanthobacteraceae bacterium]
MNEDARAAELMGKMLRKKLYVLISTPLVPPQKLKPLLATHLDYMVDLEKRGVLFASGPLTEPDGAPSGHGLTVLRVNDAAEARRIAQAEPFFAQGLRSFELKEWTVMEGMLGVRVNLSDQTVEVT